MYSSSACVWNAIDKQYDTLAGNYLFSNSVLGN